MKNKHNVLVHEIIAAFLPGLIGLYLTNATTILFSAGTGFFAALH